MSIPNIFNSKIAITTVSDKKYLFHFETFYKSFILNETNPNVFYEHFYIYKNKSEISTIVIDPSFYMADIERGNNNYSANKR